MEYILIIGGIVLAYFVTYYFWKKLSKDTVEPVAPYKVESPVETVVVPVVEPIVEEVKSVVPELKVVTGSGSKTKKTKTPVKSTTKTSVKSTTKPAPVKKPAKPRIKKPTDNA
jgi:uncharacterized protein YggT (Ycf19 family)